MDVLRPLCNELRASDASLFEIRDRLVASGMPVAMALSQCDPNNAVAVAKVLRDNLGTRPACAYSHAISLIKRVVRPGSVPQVQGVLEVRRQLDEFLAVPRPDEDDLGLAPDAKLPCCVGGVTARAGRSRWTMWRAGCSVSARIP